MHLSSMHFVNEQNSSKNSNYNKYIKQSQQMKTEKKERNVWKNNKNLQASIHNWFLFLI